MMSGEPRSTASAPMREIKVTAAADVWTIVAIAVVAYVFADTIHEAIGHGGACVLTGGKPVALSRYILTVMGKDGSWRQAAPLPTSP